MPTGIGVVETFKNLIRHGKNHNQVQQDNYSAEAQSRTSNTSSRAPQQAQPQEDVVNRKQQQPVRQNTDPSSKEAAKIIVSEEREAKSKLPSYKGLENYTLVDKMGDGAFSNVYKGIEIGTGKKVAIKVVRKYELNASQNGEKHLNPQFKKKPRVTERANILKEVQIMRGTNHPSIIKLFAFSESTEHYYLTLELMEGGELFHQIVKLTYFSENLSRHVIMQVAQGIRYLHEERGVVHRDIKPENLLFERIPIIPSKVPIHRPYDEEKEDEGEFIPGVGGGGIGRVKIADFGLSKVVWDEQTMTPCGTVGYTAPEIVKDERYSKSVDMWALGCVLYTLLCGFPPFYDESINVLTEKVARGYYTFLSPWWDDISHPAKDLVSHLLCVDPAQRYTIDEFLGHPWCNTVPAPPPPPTPAARPMDSPMFNPVRAGRRAEGRSPGIATLKEAFDITYAVHRMEEEGARRRKYNGKGGAGNRGFLAGLNEDEEMEYEEDSRARPFDAVGGGLAGPRDQGSSRAKKTVAGSRGFELDLEGATLLGRRHRRGGVGSSPLAGKHTTQAAPLRKDLPPGSPMRI